MEESRVELSAGVANGDMENRASPTHKTDGTATGGDFREDCVDLAGDDFGDGSEADAVFVSERKVVEEFPDRGDAALLKSRGALRSHAAEILHRMGQRNRVGGSGHCEGDLRAARAGITLIPTLCRTKARFDSTRGY